MNEFFKDFVAESKRIVWPSRKDLITKTKDVIVFSILVSGIIFVLDLIFSQGIGLLHQVIR